MKCLEIVFKVLPLLAITAHAEESRLSPVNWPQESLEEAERQEFIVPAPRKAQSVEGSRAMIAATASPIAIEAGLQALREGGTAADAATAVALTQVTMMAGGVVSYAGVLDALYYEASSGKTYSLYAPWKSYAGETDYESLYAPWKPDSGVSAGEAMQSVKQWDGPQGRKTLVPGFMAGAEALHSRFGKLEWGELFEPAIWYCENGIPIGYALEAWMKNRGAKVLGQTPEGRAFLYSNGEETPKRGDRFKMQTTAKTLRKIASQGASYMYEGAWAEKYVETVNAAGGKASMDDMRSYRVFWQEPLSTSYRGQEILASGRESEGGYQLLLALNISDVAGVPDMAPYWESPEAFYVFDRTSKYSDWLPSRLADHFDGAKFGFGLEDRARREYAEILWKAVNPELELPTMPASEHSCALVVVDEMGNIAAMTHTINTTSWGSMGMVVDGITISDAASINFYRFPSIEAGDYVDVDFSPSLVLRDRIPVFAISSLGRGHRRETVRIIQGVIGQGLDLETVINAPMDDTS